MTRLSPSLIILASLLALGLNAPARADQARSFVSGLGSDANAPDCTRTAPCRTFQVAHDHTLPNGEITVLDAGSYGAVAINRNISIINDGVGEAGALVSGGGNGITINAGSVDAVTLRGLTIKGIGFGGGNGIVFNSGLSLMIENCTVRNLTDAGHAIWFKPNGGTHLLTVSNTAITDNTSIGIWVIPTGAGFAVTVVLNGVGMYNNAHGFVADASQGTGRVVAAITDSVAATHTGNGFLAYSTAGHGNAYLGLDRSVSASNDVGLLVDSPLGLAMVVVGRSTLMNNRLTWQGMNGASPFSYGDNQALFNLDLSPAITIATRR
jgi:hypothetical protein